MNYPYVYKLTHKITKQFYIGYRCANTKSPELDLGYDYKSSSNIVRSIGFDNFDYEIIKTFKSDDRKEDCNSAFRLEQCLIHDNISNMLCINQAYQDIQDSKILFRRSGPHRQEIKEKISTINKSKEHRTKVSMTKIGHIQTKESNEKNRVGHLGAKASADTKAKMSSSQIGRRHSKETRQKITNGNLGNKNGLGTVRSEETKKQQSESPLRKLGKFVN